MQLDKTSVAKRFDISEKDAEEILDDLVVAGVLGKYDPDGNPEEVKRTKTRVKRVRKSMEDAFMIASLGMAMNATLQMYRDGTLDKIIDEVKEKKQ